MKIRLLIAWVLMTFSVFGQNVPSYVPTNGLVGWWPFNGNANDESGNGNNGTVNGATLITDRHNLPNSAYDFDQPTDIITSNPLNIPVNGNSSTISLWFKTPSLSFPTQSGIGTMTCWGTGFSSNNIRLLGRFSNSYDFIYEHWLNDFIFNYSFNLNQWYNLVVTFDSTDLSINTYFNGVPIANNILSLLPATTLTSLTFGNTSILTDPFLGSLDDIGIWNRALTQQEIINLYNASTSIPVISCPGASMPQNITLGLVGWWPFCGDADDESGNGNNGTVNGATLTSDRFGNVNSAYEFDGVDDFIQTNLIGPAGRTTRSFSFWISTISASEQAPIDFNLNPGNSFSIELNNPCPGIGVDCGSGVAMKGNNGIINGLWHHCVLVYDSLRHTTISDVDVFIDGQLQTAVTCSALDPNCVINNTNPSALIFGKTGSNVRFVNGKLDDIGYWNRALDSSEVAQLYHTGLCTQTIAGSCDTLIFNANITGFNPVTYANQVKVYPNPAADNLVIDCGANYAGLNGYSIRITNLLGQTVYNSPVTEQITNIQLTPPTWVNGTYVVQFVHPNGTVMDTKRIIIQ